MTAQEHKELNAKATSALNKVCRFLRDNGHDIDTEPNTLGANLDLIQKALAEGNYTIDALESVQGKIEFFFREDK